MKSEECKNGIREALALVTSMKEWVLECQREKEKEQEESSREFIQHSILYDAEKGIRRLLEQD